MIKVKLTENYVGFNIEGTFDDFYELYENIHYFLGIDESPNACEEDMRLHILGFLYDLRHAYQGSREIRAVDNGLSDEQKEYFEIKKSTKEDILYSFNYVIPELILDILLFKHFSDKKSKEINVYNTNYNNVMTFYSKIIDSLSEILTKFQIKKIKKLLIESNISEKNWLKQWYENISIDYLKMTKYKRKKEIMHIVNYICNFYDYDEFYKMKKEIEKYAKKHDVSVTKIGYGDKYPTEVEW